MTSRARASSRSAGAVALQRLTVPQEDIAAALGVSQSLVARWGLGEKVPTRAHRRLLFSEYEIPVDAWDRAPTQPPTLDRSKLPEVITASTFEEQTKALYAEVEELRIRAAHYRDHNDPKLYLRHHREAAALHLLLGKLLGVTLEINEERAVRMPAVRRVIERIFVALAPYPEAFRAARAVVRPETAEKGA